MEGGTANACANGTVIAPNDQSAPLYKQIGPNASSSESSNHEEPSISFSKENSEKEVSISQSKKWVPLCERERLSIPHIFGIAFASLAGNVVTAVLFTLFVPLSEKLKISQIGRTFILFFGSLSGFVVQPLVGVISDGVTFKYGRRRIFMIIGAIFTVVGLLVLMYSVEIGEAFNPSKPLPAQQGVMIFGIIFTCCTCNLIMSPARTLCSDVVPPSQNVLMSNVVTVYYGLGGIITNLFGGLAVYKYTSLTQESFILIVGLVICAISVFTTCIVTHEEPLKVKPPSSNPFKMLWTACRHMPKPMIRCMIVFYLQQVSYYQIGFQLSDACGREIFKGDNAIDADQSLIDKYQEGVSWAMSCNVLNYAIQFVFSLISPYLAKCVSLKWIYCSTLFLSGIAYMLFFFVKDKIGIMIMCIPVGLVQVAAFSIPYAIVTMLFPIGELGGNIGIINCFCALGQQTSNFLIGIGAAEIWPGRPSFLIGISCIFAFLGTIAAFWIIVPEEKKDINSIDSEEDSTKEDNTDPEPVELG